ncbi:MAG: hypothetical protein L0I76_13435 [Pseudonocardia sp.]|nr:hypothetical protein [Pseudonocardia sp.]
MTTQEDPGTQRRTGRARWVIWAPGLAVALGAAVATAHGLYEVAVAARVPAGIAWLYPLITDGLALVAYTATARLRDGAARYAWAVVVLAAGLSGLAQAAFLAGDPAGDGPVTTPAVLRFGIGAWPAIAAAIVAHLLYLLATHDPDAEPTAEYGPSAVGRTALERSTAGVQRDVSDGHAAELAPGSEPAVTVQRHAPVEARSSRPALPARPDGETDSRAIAAPARERARAAAQRHQACHRALPTVSELEALAQVSRGTAAAALKDVRDQPTPLHIITSQPSEPTESDDERAHP